MVLAFDANWEMACIDIHADSETESTNKIMEARESCDCRVFILDALAQYVPTEDSDAELVIDATVAREARYAIYLGDS